MSKKKNMFIEVDDLDKTPEEIEEKYRIKVDATKTIVDSDDDVGTIDNPPDDDIEEYRKDLMSGPIELSPSENFESLSKKKSNNEGVKLSSFVHPSGQNTLFPNDYTARKDRPKSKRRSQKRPYPLDLLPKRDPNAKKIVHKQNSTAYDLAKTNETEMFENIFQELIQLRIKEPKHDHAGRKGFSLKEKFWCLMILNYYQFDYRLCVSFLKKLRNDGFLSQVPSYHSICNFQKDPKLDAIFDDLILMSALPLIPLESGIGLIDSTGFSLYRYESWNRTKWPSKKILEKDSKEKNHKKEKKYHDKKEYVPKISPKLIKKFMKAHLFTLPKTNAIMAVRVTQGHVSDSRRDIVEDLISKSAKQFNINKIMGDKAFSSRPLFNIFAKLGITPYIPFKRGVGGEPLGVALWRKQWDKFYDHTEEYMKEYHIRSNIESTNNMIKAKLGHTLRTRLFIANSNEIKAKILCVNICILIREIFESGLSLDFSLFSVKK